MYLTWDEKIAQVENVPSLQAREPKFDPRNPCKNAELSGTGYNPSTVEVEEETRSLTGTMSELRAKLDGISEHKQEMSLVFHTCTAIHVNQHKYVQTHA